MSISLKKYLSDRLKKELPGKTAHIEAAPYRRVDFDVIELAKAKKSGVLILFYKKENEVSIVLIQRQKYEGTHSGQIAFPGGKYEKTDRDIIHTALREAKEEVGIIADDVKVLGQLTNVYIPVSNFNVTPVVGFIDYYPDFIIDNHEVKELIELKLSDLINVKELKLTEITLTNNATLKVPSFIFGNKIIWGATALILNELRYILRK